MFRDKWNYYFHDKNRYKKRNKTKQKKAVEHLENKSLLKKNINMTKERKNLEVLENKTEHISKDPNYKEKGTSREENSKVCPGSLIYK